MKMIVIIGKYGQLACAFQDYFKENNIPFIAFEHHISNRDDFRTLENRILEILKKENIDLLINCIAYNNVDKAEEEQEECSLLNSELPHFLATLVKKLNIDFISYSSDFVYKDISQFDRSCAYLSEDSELEAKSFYAKSKIEGEQNIARVLDGTNPRYFIIRTSSLFYRNELKGENFIDKIMKKARLDTKISVVSDQVSSPSYAPDLVLASMQLHKNSKNSGIYNFTNRGIASKFEVAQKVLAYLNSDVQLVKVLTKDLNIANLRPHFSKISTKKIEQYLEDEIPSWEERVEKYIKNQGNP